MTVSANGRYGIEVVGSAHDNVVFHTYIGTNCQGTGDLGNRLGGIYLGPGTSSNTIGGASAALQNKILYSGGNGVTIQSSSGNAVLGNEIQDNAGGGVVVIGGRNNLIGSATAGNAISGKRPGRPLRHRRRDGHAGPGQRDQRQRGQRRDARQARG